MMRTSNSKVLGAHSVIVTWDMLIKFISGGMTNGNNDLIHQLVPIGMENGVCSR